MDIGEGPADQISEEFTDNLEYNVYDTDGDDKKPSETEGYYDTADSTMVRLCSVRCLHILSHNRIIQVALKIPTVADALPSSGLINLALTNAKSTWLALLAFTAVFDLVIVLPGYFSSLFVPEWVVYVFLVFGIWSCGRFIMRMIVFPGATNRVSGEVENEFSKYSVRMLDNGADSMIDLCTLLISTYDDTSSAVVGGSGFHWQQQQMDQNSSQDMLNSSYGRYDIIPLWSKVCSYRDRVLGMYYDVISNLLTKDQTCKNNRDGSGDDSIDDITDNKGTPSTTSDASHRYCLSKYGNSNLIGDVGNLSTISPQALIDGEELLQLLRSVLKDVDYLKEHGKSLLHSSLKSLEKKKLSKEGISAAHQLFMSATKLKNFLHNSHSLSSSPSPSSSISSGVSGEESKETERMTMVRQDSSSSPNRIVAADESHGTSPFNAVKMAARALLNLIDPPPHKSIFGLDALRGSVLSRYSGARQFWVPRSAKDGGGMLDVLHIPSSGDISGKIDKAVLFCSPNAGLVEVATGMALTGGNVVVEGRLSNNATCWTDFYTDSGYDVFLFNYCGFGRSYRATKNNAYAPGILQCLKRIMSNLLFSFKPSPASIKSDSLTMALHILDKIRVNSLVIHGESIGGMAAASAARKLSDMNHVDDKTSSPITFPTLLICDRTFCNLDAVAQRLVGSWTGLVLPFLIPLWETDVAADFAAANCKKIVAQDAADAIIHDASSLKAGIAIAKESGKCETKGAGRISDAPLQYRMANWENVGVLESRFVTSSKNSKLQVPIWSSDKHIHRNEAIHFAACAERIGKVATSLKRKRFQASGSYESTKSHSCEEEGIEIAALLSREAPEIEDLEQELTCDDAGGNIVKLWETLARCDGMTGLSLGYAVKGGYDCVLTWLFSMVTFGCQKVALQAERRGKERRPSLIPINSSDVLVAEEDFNIDISQLPEDEMGGKVAQLPLPAVLKALKEMAEDISGVQGVQIELHYCIKMLDYVMARIKAQSTVSSALHTSHFRDTFDGFTTGLFINLNCGHNNQYSAGERQRLFSLLSEACDTRYAMA